MLSSPRGLEEDGNKTTKTTTKPKTTTEDGMTNRSTSTGRHPPTYYRKQSSYADTLNSNSNEGMIRYWHPPPPYSRKANDDDDDDDDDNTNDLLQVDFRCLCVRLSNINTVDFTVLIKMVITFEWNDSRLIPSDYDDNDDDFDVDFDGNHHPIQQQQEPLTTNCLPGDLWGPDILLENAQNDCEVIYDSFALLDSQTGRLKRTVTFHGHVYNPMELKDFPFDSDELTMKFITTSNWRTLDGTRFGNDPVKRIYTLHPMLSHKKKDFFRLGWGGKVPEFQILGWSQTVDTPDQDNDEPSKPIKFQLDLHLVREAQFYYLKILLPLWLMIITSVSAFGLDTDDLGSRLEVLVTLFLSTVAFLYIIQESIPKISGLTVIDKVVIASLISLVLSVFFSYLVSITSSEEQAQMLNSFFALASPTLYILVNLMLIGPPHYRYYKLREELLARQLTKNYSKSGRRLPGLIHLRRHPERSLKKMKSLPASYSLDASDAIKFYGDHEHQHPRLPRIDNNNSRSRKKGNKGSSTTTTTSTGFSSCLNHDNWSKGMENDDDDNDVPNRNNTVTFSDSTTSD